MVTSNWFPLPECSSLVNMICTRLPLPVLLTFIQMLSPRADGIQHTPVCIAFHIFFLQHDADAILGSGVGVWVSMIPALEPRQGSEIAFAKRMAEVTLCDSKAGFKKANSSHQAVCQTSTFGALGAT